MTATDSPGRRTGRRTGRGAVGLGAAACVACCAGPVIGFLAAAGLASVLAALTLGLVGLVVVAAATAAMWRRRSRRCVPGAGPVPVETPVLGPRRRAGTERL